MSDGFDTHELDDFMKDMMELANDKLPKESKKFLKKNANKLKTRTKNKAEELGILEQTGNYYKGFKSGKVYDYQGTLACRAINSSPHAHLLEYGHMQKDKSGNELGFIPGFHPFEKAMQDYLDEYYSNCEDFIGDMINNKGL